MRLSDPTQVQIDTLREYPGNPRIHSDLQIRELKRSLEKFGQYRPFVLNEKSQVLAGNGMLRAMQELGWETANAVILQDATEADERKLVLADNRIVGMGATDFDAVDEMLAQIGDYDVPGYDEQTLRDLMASAEESLKAAEDYGRLDEDQVQRIATSREPSPDRQGFSTAPTPETPTPTGDPEVQVSGLTVCPECGHSW